MAAGFEEVRSEFERNFAERGELGAACAAYVGGEKVVDLWGGVRDARDASPWEEDTLVLVYSTSKGLAAMTLALAHSRGWLDYDERVTTYWPEFGQGGKEQATVRQLLGHEAGLPVIDAPLDPSILADFDQLGKLIARQRPVWEPGTRHGYHGVSLGWYMGGSCGASIRLTGRSGGCSPRRSRRRSAASTSTSGCPTRCPGSGWRGSSALAHFKPCPSSATSRGGCCSPS